MNWTGDIYRETSTDPEGYRISTTYSHQGAFSSIYFLGQNIGHAMDIERAKEICEEHAERASA